MTSSKVFNLFYRALFFKEKYCSLKRLRDQQKDSQNDKPEHKKAKVVIKMFQDPMEVIPNLFPTEILKYFKGVELLKLSEVSKSWKTAVDRALNNRILDDVKLTIKDAFTNKKWNIMLANDRKYKHLEMNDCFEENISLLKRFSPYLKSLAIIESMEFNRISQDSHYFPELEQFTLHHYGTTWLKWLSECRFTPNLTEFRYYHKFESFDIDTTDIDEDWIDLMSECFENMSDIKHLYLRMTEGEIDVLEVCDLELDLESIDMGFRYAKDFLDQYGLTLRRLRIGCSTTYINHILNYYEDLETLAIFIYDANSCLESDDSERADDSDDSQSSGEVICSETNLYSENFDMIPVNLNITTLMIQTNYKNAWKHVIGSLPNLETLILYDPFRVENMEFLGNL